MPTPAVALAIATATGTPVGNSAVAFANVGAARTDASAIALTNASAVALAIVATPPASLVFCDNQSVVNDDVAALLPLAQGVRSHATVEELTRDEPGLEVV